MLKKQYHLPTSFFSQKNKVVVDRARREWFGVTAFPSRFGYTRFAVIIPNRVVPRAVDRNNLRRKIFEIIRVAGLWSRPQRDIVISLFKHKPITPKDEQQIISTITNLT